MIRYWVGGEMLDTGSVRSAAITLVSSCYLQSEAIYPRCLVNTLWPNASDSLLSAFHDSTSLSI